MKPLRWRSLLLSCSLLLAAGAALGAEYFPPLVFAPQAEADHVLAAACAAQLRALEEEPLYAAEPPPARECYRLTWLRPEHSPVVVRVEVRPEGGGALTIKMGSRRGGIDGTEKFRRHETRVLGAGEVAAVRAAFGERKFFELIPCVEPAEADGAEWIVEAVVAGRYHVVARWSPTSGPVHELGLKFMALAIGGELAPLY